MYFLEGFRNQKWVRLECLPVQGGGQARQRRVPAEPVLLTEGEHNDYGIPVRGEDGPPGIPDVERASR
jgi:hypothetical protein